MHKKIFSTLILVALISINLTGCDWFKKETTSNNQKQKSAQEEIEDFQGTVQDLIARGKPVKCTYQGGTDSSDEFSGVLYIADNKARQDAKGEDNGKIIEVHTIVDDRTVYFWTSEDPAKGIKMQIEETEEELKEFGKEFDQEVKQASQEQEWQKEFRYKCSKWRVDSSKFKLPTGVEFMDTSELMNQAADVFGDDSELPDRTMSEDDLSTAEDGSEGFNMDDLTKQMCAMCDNAPDPAECRAGLDCD